MKGLFLFFCSFHILLSYTLQAQNHHHIVLKDSFKNAMLKAVESSKITDSLSEMIRKIHPKDAIVLAHEGTLEALKGKHAWNPYYKLKHVKYGIKILSQAIKLNPNHIEIRFMRFTVEYYTPSFLGLSTHKYEDKKVMIQLLQQHQFAQTDKILVQAIANFLLKNTECNAQQLEILKPYAQI